MNNFKEKVLKNSKGVTLIALIITIIVLIILATISIGKIVGEDGLSKKAKANKNNAEDANVLEIIETSYVLACNNNESMEGIYQDFKERLTKNFGEEGKDWTITEEAVNTWVVVVYKDKRRIEKVIEIEPEYTSNGAAIRTAATIMFSVDGKIIKTNDTTWGGKIGEFPENPTKEKCVFKGWFDAPTGGNQYTPDSVINGTKLILHAQWERNCGLYVTYYEGVGVDYYIELNNSGVWLPIEFGGSFEGATEIDGFDDIWRCYWSYWGVDNVTSFRLKAVGNGAYFADPYSTPSADYVEMSPSAPADYRDPSYMDYFVEDHDLLGQDEIAYGETIISDTFPLTSDAWINLYGYVGCLTGDMEVVVIEEDEKGRKIRRKKKIKDIQIGDLILSYDWLTMELVENKVVYTDANEKKFQNQYDKWTFEDGTVIKTIGRHELFNVEAKCFKYMTDWKIGEHAYRIDGTKVKLVAHEVVKERVQQFKITGEKGTNYFVNDILTGDKYCPKNINL